MAETAGDIIGSALGELLVRASESPLEADETQDALKYLNRMMSALAVKGINLGYTAVSSLGDEITVADGAIEGMVKNLAIRLHPQFKAPGTPVDPLLVAGAREGLDVMMSIAIDGVGPTRFADTLPIGSGNEGNDVYGTGHFYEDDTDPVLIEQGGYISIESDTDLP